MRTMTKQRRISRTAQAVKKTLPAPVGGWNARDAITSMGPADALELINWYPRPSYVEMRSGSVQHMLLDNHVTKTLAVYRDATGDETLLAFTNTGVFDATFGGEGGAASFADRTDGRHVFEHFGDGTNTWLIAVNGVDKPFYYGSPGVVLVDGGTTPAITGITTTDIASVAVFKERLIFIRNDTMGFDYLPAGDAGGATTHFDLSSLATLGGYLMATAVWSRDAGDGPDDFAVFITSEGEAMVYQGTDPASASTWALVGTYRIGKPLGRRCVLKYGADPIVLTESGAFPMSFLLSSGDERQKFALSFKIQSAFTEAAADTVSTYGWMALSYPKQDMLLVNVPIQENGKHVQFVMNTITKSWCKFEGWDAEDFAIFARDLYYCKGARIWKAWQGTSDERMSTGVFEQGNTIAYTAQQSYQDFGTPHMKDPQLFLPILELSQAPSYTLSSDQQGSMSYAAGIETDFSPSGRMRPTAVQSSSAGVWGSSEWGEATWARSALVAQWGGTASWPGRWLSPTMRVVSNTTLGKWMGSVIRFTVGDGL